MEAKNESRNNSFPNFNSERTFCEEVFLMLLIIKGEVEERRKNRTDNNKTSSKLQLLKELR